MSREGRCRHDRSICRSPPSELGRLSGARERHRRPPSRRDAARGRLDARPAVCRRQLRSRDLALRRRASGHRSARSARSCRTRSSSGGSAQVLDEMIRVTAPGGHIYITSECCDFSARRPTAGSRRTTTTRARRCRARGRSQDVPRLFYDYVAARGCDAGRRRAVRAVRHRATRSLDLARSVLQWLLDAGAEKR